MASSKGSPTFIKDQTLWYTDLNFMPPAEKNDVWMAQWIFYLHLNGVRFIEEKRWKQYQRIENLEIDQQEYINIIDPVTPMGGGGTADYFAADFKEIPIATHLENIVRARLDKIGIENKLQVSEIDKFAKTQRQKQQDKILYQQLMRDIINTVNKQIGLPEISTSQDPYKWVKSLDKEKGSEVIDTIDNHLDYIKSEIKDNQDLALYNEYIYKGDIERAFELGIQHYLIDQNKWRIQCEWFNNSLKNYNRACGLWYVDQQSGRGTVKYIQGTKLFTLPFKEKNGEDLQGWRIEEDITFSEFVRRFGDHLTEQQLKEVFELNKQNGNHNMSWGGSGNVKGSNAMIRIGFMSCLTQDADKFSQDYVDQKIPIWQRKPLNWMSKNDKKTNTNEENRIYNVWYSCYYIPPPSSRTSNNSTADWAWQSQYIFDIKKEIDMYRYGIDQRYAKSALVIWKDDRPSFTDIKEAFMPKIRTTWHRFQNCIVNDLDSVAIAQEFLGSVLNAVDESNKINPDEPGVPTGGNGFDAGLETFKQLKQGNVAFFKMTDKNGNMMVDPGKFVIPIKNGSIEKAEKYLKLIIDQYQLMKVALAQEDNVQPHDRTNKLSIQNSIQESNDAIWFIEKPVREFLIMYGERCIQHILCILKERKKYGYKQRWEEFQNVIGLANALMIEGIENIPIEDIGLTVSLEDVSGKQQYYIDLATKMANDGNIGQEDVQMIINAIEKNYKYGAVLLSIASKKRDKQKADMEELAHERAMQLKDADLKIAMAMNQSKVDGKNSNIITQGKVDESLQDQMLQGRTAQGSILKQQGSQHKMDEATHKANLEKEQGIQLSPTPAQ